MTNALCLLSVSLALFGGVSATTAEAGEVVARPGNHDGPFLATAVPPPRATRLVAERMAPQVVGDADEYAKIQKVTRTIYEAVSIVPPTERIYLLSRADILDMGNMIGAEYRGDPVDGEIKRIVVDGVSENGKYGAEFFLSDGVLVYVYETMSFYDGTAPSPQTLNFKGFPYWERRTAFEGERVIYSRSQGTGAPSAGADGALLRWRATAVLAALEAVSQRRGQAE